MFCPKCGARVDDSAAVCPNCGNRLKQDPQKDLERAASDVFNKSGNELKSAFNDVRSSLSGNGPAPGSGQPLKTDRGLFSYIILTIITCGIYGYYFLYKIASDVNIACEGDGENTAGLLQLIILSFITCGIYAWIWNYKLGNRLANNAPRYGMTFQENGTTILMWNIFGIVLCGIGSFVAMNILIKNTNKICDAYNRAHGL